MKRHYSSLRLGWAFLLFTLVIAAGLRFWQLGTWPPGLYRDEAYNGLDALGVLAGRHALFFPANNGREPVYIYLTAVSVALWGRTALAVRLAAAVSGTVTTLITYKLAKSWFGQRVGLLSAALWAITLWPVHLSRIGFRPILLPPLLALTFWLGTMAYRRHSKWLWLAAGLAYGTAFYTYLAVRFTPLLLLAVLIYLLLTKRISYAAYRLLPPDSKRSLMVHRHQLAAHSLFVLGTAVTLLPFALFMRQHPDMLIGRTGQVSILNPAVNGGDLWGTLLRQTSAALGMFLWQGDTILRHNPAGRPVFDWLMALPFLLGILWCVRQWRRPPAAVLLLWVTIMLGPTILAEDTPHFLRAVGVLPAAIIFPALGIAWLWQKTAAWTAAIRFRWLQFIPGGVVLLLLGGSTAVTVRDYIAYSQDPDTGYLFEQAAREMGERMSTAQSGLNTNYFVDERFWSGWPSIPFLATHDHIHTFVPENSLPPLSPPGTIFAWPYASREFLPSALPEKSLIWAQSGPLARGDLEPAPYPLYAQYNVIAAPTLPILATFGSALSLHQAVVMVNNEQMQIDLIWSGEAVVPPDLTVFVHVVGPQGVITQSDAPPGSGNWWGNWWRPGLMLHERRTLNLPIPFDPAQLQILIGVYDGSQTRLLVRDVHGIVIGDTWQIEMGE